MTERKLVDYAYSHGVPTSARCSICHRPFKVPAIELARPEAARQYLYQEFTDHTCKEDPSQAAARIVREATKD